MSQQTSIEWTDATWNPVTGCTEVSEGCDRCYARTFAQRFAGTPGHYYEHGFAVQLRPGKLRLPLSWRRPRRVFVNSMSDLFHAEVSEDYLVAVFAVMAATPQHTYQVLTKRHGRMHSVLGDSGFQDRIIDFWDELREEFPDRAADRTGWDWWPLPNVWLGVSAENQRWADVRIPVLLDTPAAVRFVSCEPLLGSVDLSPWLDADSACERCDGLDGARCAACPLGKAVIRDEDFNETTGQQPIRHLDWVIAGGESGHGARPMDPAWVRLLRDQCEQARVAFLFKQWGAWEPAGYGIGWFEPPERLVGPPVDEWGHRQLMRRVGKRRAGRELDGRTWAAYPGQVAG